MGQHLGNSESRGLADSIIFSCNSTLMCVVFAYVHYCTLYMIHIEYVQILWIQTVYICTIFLQGPRLAHQKGGRLMPLID